MVARIRHGGLTFSDSSQIAVGEGAAWVSSCCSVVSRIDPYTNAVAEVLGGFDGRIAAGLRGVWLAAGGAGLLWWIDPRAESSSRTIGVGTDPLDVAVGERSVWVANGDGTVSRVDPISLDATTIRVGKSVGGIAVGEGAVWVTVG